MGDIIYLRYLSKYFAIFVVNGFFSIFAVLLISPDGGIGRRAGLKHQW
jgi:hypothetical protein